MARLKIPASLLGSRISYKRIDKVLGKGRAELFQAGKLSINDMVDGARPMTLAELRAKYEVPILKPMKNDAYDLAKSGGRHYGFFDHWSKQKKSKIERSIKSLKNQVDFHSEKIANPSKYIDRPVSSHELSYLVSTYWPKEIRNFEQQINILEGVLLEMHNVKK